MAPNNRSQPPLTMFGYGYDAHDPNRTLSSLSSLPYDPLQPPLPSSTLSSLSSLFSHPHSHSQASAYAPLPLTSTSSQISHTFLQLPPSMRSDMAVSGSLSPAASSSSFPPPIPLESSSTLFNSSFSPFPQPLPLESTSTLYHKSFSQFSFSMPPGAQSSADYSHQLGAPSLFPPSSAFSTSLPPYDPPLHASSSSHSTASTDSFLATSSISSEPPSRSSSPETVSTTITSAATIALPTSASHPDLLNYRPDQLPSPTGSTSSRRQSLKSSRAQPATIRRQKHREVDTTRRQKEHVAFKRLSTLAARRVKVERARGDEDEEDDSEAAAGGSGDNERKAKAKLRVLQDSARKMAEMHTLIERLVDTNRSLVHQLATATHQPIPAAHHSAGLALSILPPSGPQLEAAVVSQSLGSTMFLSSGVGQLVVDVLTGSVVDVNDRLLAVTRWERQHLLGRILIAPYDLMTAGNAQLSPERTRYIHSQSVLVEAVEGLLAPARLDEKVAVQETVEAVRALYRGEVDWISAVWRLPLRDGRWYDVPCVNYIGAWLDVEDGSSGSGNGARARRPSTMMFLLSSTSITPSK